MDVAESQRLRNFVQETTLDTWLGPKFMYRLGWKWGLLNNFLDALPFFSCSKNLSTLRFSFHKDCRNDDSKNEETYDARHRTPDTVFQYVAGTLTHGKQRLLCSNSYPDLKGAFIGNEHVMVESSRALLRLHRASEHRVLLTQ